MRARDFAVRAVAFAADPFALIEQWCQQWPPPELSQLTRWLRAGRACRIRAATHLPAAGPGGGSNRTLDDPGRFAQPTPMGLADLGEQRRDAALSQALLMRLGA
ncbi:hypothetical protein BED46_042685 [Burkholderia contaminans]|nr:hypothetical protein BGI28_16470 [Burkholderia contaminans]OMI78103.1 hypothetical protein BED46_042685 [Burkholderia contaminans]BBA41612.1 hypothetical protein BCCH1_40780 [Burkholderia contaminans]GLZ73295.1 hypothetical protein Bcon01_63400 [Burkholderia contaminans]